MGLNEDFVTWENILDFWAGVLIRVRERDAPMEAR